MKRFKTRRPRRLPLPRRTAADPVEHWTQRHERERDEIHDRLRVPAEIPSESAPMPPSRDA